MNTLIDPIRVEHPSVPDHRKMFSLERLAYVGGASTMATVFKRHFEEGKIGVFIESRVEVLIAFKKYCEELLVRGDSELTVGRLVSDFMAFVIYCDSSEVHQKLSFQSLEKAVFDYCDHLVQRALSKNDKLKKVTAYSYGKNICTIATKILNSPFDLFYRTRVREFRKSRTPKKAVGKQADKLLKSELEKFGSVLLDVMNGITKELITGPMPLRVPIRHKLVENDEILLFGRIEKDSLEKVKLNPDEYIKIHMKDYHGGNPKKSAREYLRRMKKRLSPSSDLMKSHRYTFFNYRIQAEMRMFIALTQGNLQPVKDLKREKFSFKPMGDFYQVRNYKNRKGGNVLFEVHRAYRPYFEAYLNFRDDFVSTYPMKNDDLLFPFFQPPSSHGTNKEPIYGTAKQHHSFRKNVFLDNAIPWVNSKDLRQAALNILHQYSDDENLTAEQASHTVGTFKQNYEKPSLHKANIEVTRFWSERDPIKVENLKVSIIKSQCDNKPVVTDDKPPQIVEPNCINPSGCLWCDKHRDIESFDYIWSLVSMRYLKRIESSLFISDGDNPIEMVINRINSKIEWFNLKNQKYADWITEAEIRVDEELDFHPFWLALIDAMER